MIKRNMEANMNIYKFAHIGEDGEETVMLEGTDDLVFAKALTAALKEEAAQNRELLAELLAEGKITQGQFDQLTGDVSGQTTESLQDAGYEVIWTGGENAIVKNLRSGKQELFVRSEDHAGWGLEIEGTHYEFVREHEESGEEDGS